MRRIITISTLLLSQLMGADADTATMSENEKNGILREFRVQVQSIDPGFNVTASVTAGKLPGCFSAKDLDVQSRILGLSDIVARIRTIPTKNPATITYFTRMQAEILRIKGVVEERTAVEAIAAEAKRLADEKTGLEELERMAALVGKGGLLGDSSVNPTPVGAGDPSVDQQVVAVEGDDSVVMDPVDTAVAQVVAAATSEPTPFESATAAGIERLKKMCPALFSPSDGLGLAAWWGQVEYATVRSPALVNLAASLLVLSDDEAELTGKDAAKIIELIEAFKAVFKDAKGEPYKGSQETKFLTEKTTDNVTVYRLKVKANSDDEPAETIIIKVDRTDADNLVVTASAPEIARLSAIMFTTD